MIEFRTGDILKSEADALVNSVNCVGIMGRGLALQFKNAFPANFEAYAAACRRREVQPGKMFVFETGRLTPPRYIINFPTKRHWRGKSRIEDIEAGLSALAQLIRKLGIHSIAVPPLGSGLGGLDWASVRPLVLRALEPLANVRATVYEPDGQQRRTRSHKRPDLTPGRAALIGLMDRYLAGLLDPFISLLEIHKLMYFMQQAGEPLRLSFQKARYGPYATNLRHVLSAIEGYWINGYDDGGDRPNKLLSLIPGALAEANEFLSSHPATRARFDRISALTDGFESPMGLELLATVHWVMTRDLPRSPDETLSLVHAWSSQKQQFTIRQIRIASETLAQHGWVAPQAAHSAP